MVSFRNSFNHHSFSIGLASMTDYEILKKISEGAFGAVELVIDQDGNKFARKMLHEQRHRDNIYNLIRKRFHDEVNFMKSNPHKNITPIIEAEPDVKRPWFIMPVAKGSIRCELKNIKNNKKLLQKALLDILSGLEFMHYAGYYHRDLCCANVLLFEEENNDITFKLSDLGTVTLIGSKGPFHKLDSGHKRYAAPEITKLPMIGSEKSDYYGFGAILHELIGENERTPRKNITDENGPFAHIMNRCTKILPQDRYPNIESIRHDIIEAINLF